MGEAITAPFKLAFSLACPSTHQISQCAGGLSEVNATVAVVVIALIMVFTMMLMITIGEIVKSGVYRA